MVVAANHNKINITYRDVIDYMTRKRINVAFKEKGFVDPLVAASCTQLDALRGQYGLALEQVFKLFDPIGKGTLTKE